VKGKTAIIFLTILLSMLTISVYCQSILTIPYSDFTTTLKDHATAYQESSWTAEITNNLVFNQSASGYVMIQLANSSGSSYYAVMIHLAKSSSSGKVNLNILVPTKVDPSANDWVSVFRNDTSASDKITVTLLANGKLYVGNSVETSKYVNGHYVGSFKLSNVRTEATANNVVTSGSVTVEIKGAVGIFDYGSFLDTFIKAIIAIIPVVLIVTVMEKVFKRVTKIGR
jgi:hypothetical protein